MPRRKTLLIAMASAVITAVLVFWLGEEANASTLANPSAQQQERPYGITCGNKPCTLTRKHGCKHRRNKKHRCRKPGHHQEAKPSEQRRSQDSIPVKTGPFCDQHVYVKPDSAECGSDVEMSPVVCTQEVCGPVQINPPPCAYNIYNPCEEKVEPLEAKDMEVFQSEFKGPPTIYGCAYVYGATEYGMHSDRFTIEFRARHGSFESTFGGFVDKYSPVPHYCAKYVPPCPENMPADGYDMAWVVVYDRTKQTYVESEQVVFNIEEPEDVRHPVG